MMAGNRIIAENCKTLNGSVIGVNSRIYRQKCRRIHGKGDGKQCG